MSDHLGETIDGLRQLAQSHERVLVGFSGGKDSLAVLDLALRNFRTVVPFFCYFVPGLRCEESKVELAERFFKVTVLRVPDTQALDCLKAGYLCDEHQELDSLPDLNQRRFYNWLKHETRCTLILRGDKKADGPFRRMRMGNQRETMSDVHFPLKHWKKIEVLSYLKMRTIPVPSAESGENSAVGLFDYEILHMHDHHPEDYERMRAFFPYIEVYVHQRDWFGTAGRKTA